MRAWQLGMSGNLVADLIAVYLIYLASRLVLDRRVAAGVIVQSIVALQSDPRIERHRHKLELVNASSEPLLSVRAWTLWPEEERGMRGDRLAFVEDEDSPSDLTNVMAASRCSADLGPTGPRKEFSERRTPIVVEFSTIRGSLFRGQLNYKGRTKFRWRGRGRWARQADVRLALPPGTT